MCNFKGEYLRGKKWNGILKTTIMCSHGYHNEYKIKNGKGDFAEFEDSIFYEGFFLNGEKNGKVKEYNDNSILKFDGEYILGQKNGKVKEYNDNGILLFDGEYLKGKRWNGKGKDYNNNKNLTFDGEYLKGIAWNGIINNYISSNLLFENQLINGKIIGKFLKEFDNGKLIYVKNHLNKKMKWLVKEYDSGLMYKGEYLGWKKHGKIKEYFGGMLWFDGYYLNGKKMEKERNIIY